MSNSQSMQYGTKGLVMQFIPVMLCFFAMGFVDLIGAASNYVTKDFELSPSESGFLPFIVFIMFLFFSVPSGMLMNKIGRKKTVLISLIVTACSLIIPVFGYTLPVMLVSFSLLGIGNAIMQTSLNPLVSNLINPDKLASTLTFGQFVKAIASFLGPIIATWGATAAIPAFGLSWRVVFAIYALVSILSIVLLAATPINEERPDRATGFVDSLRLLGRPFILLCFIGIVCHVGIDVGTNQYAPKILEGRLNMALTDAAFATSLYFIFRTAGCFLGGFLLRIMQARVFFAISVAMMIASMALLFVGESLALIYVGIALVGFGNSNIFSIVFSQALIACPNEKNEVSGLMIMGLVGGAIFPLIMGFASDAMGLAGAVTVMTVGVAYLVFYTTKIHKV